MEEKNTPVTQTEEKIEGNNEVVDTKVETTEANKSEEKKFSQDEVNTLLKKERKGLPSKEELEEFKKWKDSQKTDEEKKAEAETKLKKAEADSSEKDKVITMYKQGVNEKYMDFLLFTVSKMDGDFSDNLANYIKENPEYGKAIKEESKATGIPVKTIATQRSGVADILAKKHPECNF